MKGFVLFLTATILLTLLFFPILIYSICSFILNLKIKEINNWFFTMAVGVDQFGNIFGCELFNHIFISKHSKNKFGNEDETISSVIGKNKKENTLLFCGRSLDLILNKFELNHSVNSIEIDEQKK